MVEISSLIVTGTDDVRTKEVNKSMWWRRRDAKFRQECPISDRGYGRNENLVFTEEVKEEIERCDY